MAAPAMFLTVIAGSAALLSGCAAQPSAAPAAQAATSILLVSRPAPGATVRAPVDTLELHFNPPARLDEVVISGPGGLMPTMVHAVGEVADYSIPLSGLDAGAYNVNWRATSQGRAHQGSFTFTVK